jgi:hypothetical protein
MFVLLKGAIRRHRFTSDQQVKEAVHARLTSQQKLFFFFFRELIRKLASWWTECIENKGEYMGKS